MLGIVTTAFLLLFTATITHIELNRYGTFMTPFSVFMWPYVIIVSLINTLGQYMGFYQVNLVSAGFVMASSLSFFLGGAIVLRLTDNEKYYPIIDTIGTFKVRLKELSWFYYPLALIAIAAGGIHFVQSLSEVGGLLNIGTEDFAVAYGTGFLSHLQNLSRIAIVLLVADYIIYKRRTVLVLIVLCFMVIFIRQVKYHIISIVFASYYFAYLNGLVTVSVRKLFKYSAVVFALFMSSYYIGFLAVSIEYTLDPRANYRLLFHFFTYLFGGPIAFSEIFSNPGYPLYSAKEIIAPLLNIFRAISGEDSLVDIIIYNWVSVSGNTDMFHSANVFGATGMLYMYIGPYMTLIYWFVGGGILYYLMMLTNRKPQLVNFQLVYSLMLSLLVVGFFDLYFNKLVVYETTLYMIVLPPAYLLLRQMLKYLLNGTPIASH